MKVIRVVPNIAVAEPAAARAFYGDVLGLEIAVDLGWFATFTAEAAAGVPIGFGRDGGSGTPVPDLSIEVDDLEAALARCRVAGIAIEYGPADEPWGVRRFYARDPFGRLADSLVHA